MLQNEIDWIALSERVRRGDRDAEAAFASMCSRGIRFYIQRNLGSERLEERVQRVLRDVVERMRQGRIQQSGDATALLRKAVRRWRTGRREPAEPEAAVGPEAHARIQAKAEILKTALHGCSKREMEMLIRYYAHGQDARQVLEDMGATEEEFAEVRSRLRLLAASKKLRKPPAREHETVKVKAAAGG